MRTVFHVSSPSPADQQHAMVNVSNLPADESVYSADDEVIVLTTGAGVRMLVKATTGNHEMVESLANQGVVFRACRNALRGMDATDDDLLPGVEGVPSGSGELARLQDENFGYVKAP